MFGHDNCQATDTCKNWPGHWVWCFRFGDEQDTHAFWVQVCGFHLPLATRIVSMMDKVGGKPKGWRSPRWGH